MLPDENGINIGEAAEQSVFHCHMHIIPRCKRDLQDSWFRLIANFCKRRLGKIGHFVSGIVNNCDVLLLFR